MVNDIVELQILFQIRIFDKSFKIIILINIKIIALSNRYISYVLLSCWKIKFLNETILMVTIKSSYKIWPPLISKYTFLSVLF